MAMSCIELAFSWDRMVVYSVIQCPMDAHSMIRIKTKGVYIIYPCCYIILGGKAAG